jgi:NAD(P)-dependent dehydrogenase (short-subunit alcohol dehydrogenase family)
MPGNRRVVAAATDQLGREHIRVNGVHAGIIETALAYDPATGELIVGI